jgi:hypothetical protein
VLVTYFCSCHVTNDIILYKTILIVVVRWLYTSIFLWGCGNFFTLIGNSVVFCVCGFEFSVRFCATDGGYFFLGVVLYLFAGLRNRRSSGPPEVAVHPKPWSTEVIFEIGARLYIGVGVVTCFRGVKNACC